MSTIKMDEYLEEGKSYTRLYNEYKKYSSLAIGYDFDSTVHDYHKVGASYEMVKQLLRDLKSIGCKTFGRKDSEETRLKKSISNIGKPSKPKRKIDEFDLDNNYIKTWESVSELIFYYKSNNLGFDYTTFLKKLKENREYKNKYWNESTR